MLQYVTNFLLVFNQILETVPQHIGFFFLLKHSPETSDIVQVQYYLGVGKGGGMRVIYFE
jgi:hypothetical protein